MVRGLDQSRFKLMITSMMRCESMDIRFTVSPTERSFFAAPDSFRDFLNVWNHGFSSVWHILSEKNKNTKKIGVVLITVLLLSLMYFACNHVKFQKMVISQKETLTLLYCNYHLQIPILNITGIVEPRGE